MFMIGGSNLSQFWESSTLSYLTTVFQPTRIGKVTSFSTRMPLLVVLYTFFFGFQKSQRSWSPAVPRIPNQIILRGTTCGRLGDGSSRYGAADNWVATISQVRRVLKLKSYTGGIVLNADKESDFLRN